MTLSRLDDLSRLLSRSSARAHQSAAGGRLGRQELFERAGAVSKFAADAAEVEIGRLVWTDMPAREGDELVVTPAARELQGRAQEAVVAITARLWATCRGTTSRPPAASSELC